MRNLVLLLVCLALCGCASKDSKAFSLEPKGFMNVPDAFLFKQFAVSPETPRNTFWRGVLIAIPRRIVVHKNASKEVLVAQLPVCVSFMLGWRDIQHVHEPDLFVRDTKTGELYQAQVTQHDDSLFTPPRIARGDESTGIGGYMAFNLLEYIDLPAKPGMYDVWIRIGETACNPSRVQIVFSNAR